MKCRFYLLDVNEGLWEGKPCVRLWGIDEQGRRVEVIATQISPYFYFLPTGDLDSTLKRLAADKQRFPKIDNVTLEKRKLMGREKTVLRVVCSEANSVSIYAKQLPKLLGGVSFDDLRLSARYITDLMLTTCGWNECEIEPASIDGATAEKAYLAVTLPTGIISASQPKLRFLAFLVLAVGQKGSARPERDPIRALAVATDSGIVSIFVASGDDDSEVLSAFTAVVNEFDPDVMVGYDTNKLQWPYLMQRAKVNKKKLAVGRDQSEPHTSVYGHVSVAGRANLDLADLAAGITEIKVKDLKNLGHFFSLATAERLAARDEWETFDLWSDHSGRQRLLEDTKISARICLELGQDTIDYPTQLSAITGLPLDQVMTAAVGFRVDSYFLRIAHGLGELIPTKNEQPFLTFRGALVQEPETGLHENVVVLDFASMYPRLMEKYNLSPDTLVRPGDEVSAESVNLVPEVGHRFRKEPAGFYKIGLTSLIEERARVRRELACVAADSTTARVLREREGAVKVITNACYGYAGWAGARWYVREVAESAAAFGRQNITEAIDRAKALGLEVIYSDTDSIFVSNIKPRVDELIGAVNEEQGLEIRIEREYVRVLFTEAMKRYAGLRKDETIDTVGLEAVRGDWSEIAREVQENVLRAILKFKSTEVAIVSVRETVRRLREGIFPMEVFIIRKALTKPIEEYRVRTPHVEVARKLAEEGWEIGVGDKVGYVIVKGQGALFQKARPYRQVKPEDLDLEYYVENQVKPAAMRLLEGFGVSEQQVAA
jgi:DNA polymerase I